MCGISGILNLDGRHVNRADIRLMNRLIVHRGPDENGIFVDKQVGLGSSRLSIIDLKDGKQPIHNEDKTCWIVFNGEIYNYRELRARLINKGHLFLTNSDTEVILHLYEEEGEKLFRKIDGMFSLAIWDEKKQLLLLGRDPMGKKPLYYALINKSFYFASELKAIKGVLKEALSFDNNLLAKYLLYGYIPSPNTIFTEVKRLAPGSFMKVVNNSLKAEVKYWEIDYSKQINISVEEIEQTVVDLLKKAIAKRMISDVPLGLFLSGGIDSSLIAALLPTKNIEAFTIGFEDQKIDESKYALEVARYVGIKHNLKIFSHKEAALMLPKALKLMDEPMADPSILPTFLLSSFTRDKVKVALSGDGGDESFAGYPKYLANYLLNFVSLPNVSQLQSFLPAKFSRFLQYANYPIEYRNQFWISSFTVEEIKELTGKSVSLLDIEKINNDFKGSNFDKPLFLDQKMTLTDQYLVKVDRASMANSLEVRCPFLDRQLIEFSAKIPFSLKIKGFKTKYLLRDIAKNLLPSNISKLKKRGFGIPLERWLKTEWLPLKSEYLSEERIKKENIFNLPAFKKILARNDPNQLWKLLVFEIWKDLWMKS